MNFRRGGVENPMHVEASEQHNAFVGPRMDIELVWGGGRYKTQCVDPADILDKSERTDMEEKFRPTLWRLRHLTQLFARLDPF